MKSCTPETLQQHIDATLPIKQPKPVEHIVSELYQFGLIFTKEAHRFTQRGLSEEFLLCATVLADELKKREELWSAKRFDEPESVVEWRRVRESAYALRTTVSDNMALALMDNQKAQLSLIEVKRGKGDADLLLDLGKLLALARANLDDVLAGGLSETYLLDVDSRRQELVTLYTNAKTAIDKTGEYRIARDKAKHFSYEYLKLIRRYVKVIYRDEPKKRKLFVSSYKQKSNRTYRIKKASRTLPPS